MASQYDRGMVFLGSAGAHVFLTLTTSLFGHMLFEIVEPRLIQLASIIIFILYTLYLLHELLFKKDKQANAEQIEAVEDLKEISQKLQQVQANEPEAAHIAQKYSKFKFFLISFSQIFLGELGDKSQLMTLALTGYS